VQTDELARALCVNTMLERNIESDCGLVPFLSVAAS